jgi:hypothetical protein
MFIRDHDLDTTPLNRNYFETHNTNTECIICMSQDRRKKIVQIKACSYVFHAQCLTTWVNAQIDDRERTCRLPESSCAADTFAFAYAYAYA